MKKIFFIFICSIQLIFSQKSNWIKYFITPDLIVHFPDSPLVTTENGILKYEYKTNNTIFLITSEKSPFDYSGRKISEVEDEYYKNLTKRTLSPNQLLLSEKDFLFENQKVREIIYNDTIDNIPCIVTLQILNVIGIHSAMYKFYLIDFKNRAHAEEYDDFFSGWDLYPKIEENIKKKDHIENPKTNNYLGRFLLIGSVLLIAIILVVFFNKYSSK